MRIRGLCIYLSMFVFTAILPISVQTVVAQEQASQDLAPLEIKREQLDGALEQISGEMMLSSEKLGRLQADIDALKKDQTTITAALIQSAKTDKKLAQEIELAEQKLIDLREQEDGIRVSLIARRKILAEVLAALQRMGLSPPPAILVRPDDALASVRSAVLLGAVVPEMRQQTLELMDDLQEMQRLTASIKQEQERLKTSQLAQLEEQKKQQLLLIEKQKLQQTSEEELLVERERSELLAQKATSLQELISGLQDEMDKARSAAESARRQAEQLLSEGQQRAASQDEDFLNPRVDFNRLRGHLIIPVAGKTVTKFGRKDDFGRPSMGEMLQTAKNATITSPSDGVVLYAGKFRSYGQLLIIDAGGGYHIVMAGMDRINVAQGQFVLSGEPVGAMGDRLLTSVASLDDGNSAPKLYIEFRKDGKSVDPAPWWSERLSGRTQDDT